MYHTQSHTTRLILRDGRTDGRNIKITVKCCVLKKKKNKLKQVLKFQFYIMNE